MSETNSLSKDPTTGVKGRLTLASDVRVAEKYMLLYDDFETTTLGTSRWDETTAATGAVTVSGGVCDLTTGTNTAGSAIIQSDMQFAPFGNAELIVQFLMRFGTDADTDNTREVGLRDAAGTTKVYFQLDDSSLTAQTTDAGGGTDQSETINAVTVNDNAFELWEIVYSKRDIRFVINGTQVAGWTTVGETVPLLSHNVFHVYALNTNSGSTTDNSLEICECSLYLAGDIASGPARRVSNAATSDAQMTRGPGIIEGIYRRASNSQVWILRDGTSASGRALFTSTAANPVQGYFLPVKLYFAHGLYFDHSSGVSADSLDVFVRT